MLGGLRAVLARELVTTARRKATYDVRVAVAIGIVAALGGAIYLSFPDGPGGWEVPAWRVRDASRGAFAGMIAMMTLMVVGVLAGRSQSSIAQERERGTLAKLLTTRLYAFEIVVGKLVAALVFCVAAMASGIPILVLLDQFGGADPWLIGLACVGLVSWAFFLCALWLAATVESRVEKLAAGLTAIVVTAWIDVPLLLAILGPRLSPNVYSWVRPINLALLAGCPMCVPAHLMGIVPRPSFTGMIVQMAATQAVLGALLTAWAVARLRPAARRLDGGAEAEAGARRRRRGGRIRSRPPCGDDPMQWKERYTSRPGPIAWALGIAVYLTLFALFGYVTWVMAWPAWDEAWGTGAPPMTPGDVRWVFNQLFLRPMTGAMSFLVLLLVVGQTVEAFDLERKRGTWLVLLATPLTGREILGARRSAVRRRWYALGLIPVALWATGLAVGAVHPLGVVAALAAWYATMRLATALGAYTAMWTKQDQEQGWIFLLAMFLCIAAALAPWALGGRPELAPIGVISPPFLAVLSLLSGPEVRAILGQTSLTGVKTASLVMRPGSAPWLAVAIVLGPVLHLLAARWFDRATDRKFAAVVGRTDRDVEPPPSGEGRPAR